MSVFCLVAWTTILPDFIVKKAEARSKYMKLYNVNQFAKSERKSDCKICHINERNGENTYFGEAFAESEYEFSKDLRTKYQDLFNLKPRKKGKK